MVNSMQRKKRKPDKKHVARTPVAVEKYKQLFLAQLEKGRSPGVAARNVNIARCTAYGWKKEDREFDAAWRDAVETGLDVLETAVYKRGLEDGGEDARFLLKHRRYNIENRAQQNFVPNISLEEHTKRLERLGLPIPQIEGDYEPEDYVDAATNHP
jgi:hypothetical protein